MGLTTHVRTYEGLSSVATKVNLPSKRPPKPDRGSGHSSSVPSSPFLNFTFFLFYETGRSIVSYKNLWTEGLFVFLFNSKNLKLSLVNTKIARKWRDQLATPSPHLVMHVCDVIVKLCVAGIEPVKVVRIRELWKTRKLRFEDSNGQFEAISYRWFMIWVRSRRPP